MPTYEYLCAACGHAFEEFQSMTARIRRTCPECGRKRLDRLFGTGGGVIFKGSGFYETDYKRKSPPGGKKDESRSDAKPDARNDAKPESKSESKPASKPEAKSDSKGDSGSDRKSGSGPAGEKSRPKR